MELLPAPVRPTMPTCGARNNKFCSFIVTRAPFSSRWDEVRYKGLYTSDMSQTRELSTPLGT
eukprot:1612802-Pyramimonas_sp.AAC.1